MGRVCANTPVSLDAQQLAHPAACNHTPRRAITPRHIHAHTRCSAARRLSADGKSPFKRLRRPARTTGWALLSSPHPSPRHRGCTVPLRRRSHAELFPAAPLGPKTAAVGGSGKAPTHFRLQRQALGQLSKSWSWLAARSRLETLRMPVRACLPCLLPWRELRGDRTQKPLQKCSFPWAKGSAEGGAASRGGISAGRSLPPGRRPRARGPAAPTPLLRPPSPSPAPGRRPRAPAHAVPAAQQQEIAPRLRKLLLLSVLENCK